MAAMILGPGSASAGWGGLCSNGQWEVKRQLPVQEPGTEAGPLSVSSWAPSLELLGQWVSALRLPAPQPFGDLRRQQALRDVALGWISSVSQRICAPQSSLLALCTRLSPAQKMLYPAQLLGARNPAPWLPVTPPGSAHPPAQEPQLWPSAAGCWVSGGQVAEGNFRLSSFNTNIKTRIPSSPKDTSFHQHEETRTLSECDEKVYA